MTLSLKFNSGNEGKKMYMQVVIRGYLFKITNYQEYYKAGIPKLYLSAIQ